MTYLTSTLLNAAFSFLLFWQYGAGDKVPSNPSGTGANEAGSTLIFTLAAVGLTLAVIAVVALPFVVIYRNNVRQNEQGGDLQNTRKAH
jgi:hypothetical protein